MDDRHEHPGHWRILEQEDGHTGGLRPISYFSSILNKTEINCSTIEKEALEIVYGLEIDRPVILGHPIEIKSDHHLLVWLLTVANPTGKCQFRSMILMPDTYQVRLIM